MFWQMVHQAHTDAKFRTGHTCQELAKFHGSCLDMLFDTLFFVSFFTPDDSEANKPRPFLHTGFANSRGDNGTFFLNVW